MIDKLIILVSKLPPEALPLLAKLIDSLLRARDPVAAITAATVVAANRKATLEAARAAAKRLR